MYRTFIAGRLGLPVGAAVEFCVCVGQEILALLTRFKLTFGWAVSLTINLDHCLNSLKLTL